MDNTEGRGRNIAIVAYRPKAGKEADLLALTREHVDILQQHELATKHPVTTCRAADGTLIEVFEWEAGGIERAHNHPAVAALWARYAEACEYVPLNTLPETADMFATFTPLVD